MTNIHKYNGWTNRNTWLVNLHFSDSFDSVLDPLLDENFIDQSTFNDKEEIEQITYKVENTLREFIEEFVDTKTEKFDSFIKDLIDISDIDYLEIADCIVKDYISNNKA